MRAQKSAFRPQCEQLEARDVPSFGTGGFVNTDIVGDGGEVARALAIQPDGKIVAAGSGGIVRYNSDGSLDATFNPGGAQPGIVPVPNTLRDVAIQADGKIVVGGSQLVKDSLKGPDSFAFLLMRFHANGAPDTSFGTGGKVVQNFGKGTASDSLRSLALQADGKIVAVGLINDNSWGNTSPALGRWGVARFNTSGTLDKSFDGDGFLATQIIAGQYADAEAVAIDSFGRIVVGGDTATGTATRRDVAVVRYLANGALDTSFGGTGKVQVDFSPEYPAGGSSEDLRDLAIQSDGRIVFVGDSSVSGPSRGLIGRLNSNGSLDTTFGGDGRVLVEVTYTVEAGTFNRLVAFTGLAVQPDGKIVAWSPSYSDTQHPSTVARVNADGSLDTSFDGDGIVHLTWPGGYQNEMSFGGIAVQSDGKIVVCGGHQSPTSHNFDLARLNPDGTFDI
jgi:uncharacterized delta-60 repeat protein